MTKPILYFCIWNPFYVDTSLRATDAKSNKEEKCFYTSCRITKFHLDSLLTAVTLHQSISILLVS